MKRSFFATLVTLCVIGLALSSPVFALNDELECYKAKDKAFLITANLTFINDQAILESRGCAIIKGKLWKVCVPADTNLNGLTVNGAPASENPVDGPEITYWYACYRLKCDNRIQPANVLYMNRLVDSETDLIADRPGEVCFPFEAPAP